MNFRFGKKHEIYMETLELFTPYSLHEFNANFKLQGGDDYLPWGIMRKTYYSKEAQLLCTICKIFLNLCLPSFYEQNNNLLAC